MNEEDKKKHRRISAKKWKQKNKQKVSEYMKGYRERNKEKIRRQKNEYMKEYTEKNKNVINKRRKEDYQRNKEKYNERSKQYFLRNKDRVKEYRKKYTKDNENKLKQHSKEYRKKIREDFLLQFKKGKSCSVCGYNKYPEILQFHHKNREEKSFNISVLRQKSNLSLLKEEIKKCILLCPNCHRWLHFKEGK